MPVIPTIMSYNEWLSRTNRKKTLGKGDKARSDGDGGLQAVDRMVQVWETSKTPDMLEGLGIVLNAWVRKKTKNGTLNTIRDHVGAVSDLTSQVNQARHLVEPLPFNAAFPGIFIGADTYRGKTWVPDDYMGETKQALQMIASKPVGAALLKTISDNCGAHKKVVIDFGSLAMAAPVDDTSNEFRRLIQLPVGLAGGEQGFAKKLLSNMNIVVGQWLDADGPRGSVKRYVGGSGSSAVVTWDHASPGNPPRPAFIALAHELVHASHYLQGSCYRGIGDDLMPDGDSGIMEEEMRTVGFGRYATESPSENAIRAEHNETLRTSYVTGWTWSKVRATLINE